jgi:hypothetical protein
VKALIVAAALALPAALRAQVGYPPDRSPYRDLEFRQELTTFTGYFSASEDPVKVAPQSGPLLGLRYEVRIGGPAQLFARVARVFSERAPIDPTLPEAQRRLPTQSWPLYLSDVGIALNLTGQKSLHSFVPVLNGGIGVASDFKGRDPGDYQFGTSFAFTFGAGVRWVPGGRFQLRADISDYLYKIEYPPSYTLPSGGNPAVLGEGQGRSSWQNNAVITLGASYLFFR